jgi:PIN domain nuclease of toxin-antitoxin system
MRLLIDAHSLLWFLEDNPRLSTVARDQIHDLTNERQVSIVNLWEISIKVNIGKLPLVRPFPDLFPGQLHRNGITILDLTVEHVTRLATLPMHHRDPFDRMLIAQAMVEGIPILTADKAFDAYEVECIW